MLLCNIYRSNKEDTRTQENVEWVEKASGIMVEMINGRFMKKRSTKLSFRF